MCKVLNVSRSSYYAFLDRKPSNRSKEFDKFSALVKECFNENKHIYGAIKIQKNLTEKGIPCSVKRVQRHMQRQGLRSVVVRKYNHHSNRGSIPDDKENILNRDFTAKTPHQKLVTDITYIYVAEVGWTYLASVMDLYSRKIIGYAYGKHMTAGLAVKAVRNACLNIKNTNGIILHSDLGSQYTSTEFEEYLQELGMIHSFSRKGNPYDNACIESFHAVLKKEEVYRKKYATFKEAQRSIFEYIESWYNRKRIHESIGYRTPQKVEEEGLENIS